MRAREVVVPRYVVTVGAVHWVQDTDVLITHGPPLLHGDTCADGFRAGCVNLLYEIQQRIKPKYVGRMFGVKGSPNMCADLCAGCMCSATSTRRGASPLTA